MKTILDAIKHPGFFGPAFKDLTSWDAWLAFLAAFFALPMTEEQLEIYRQRTGRKEPPTSPFKEAFLPIGRRGGKSLISALIAVYLSCFKDYTKLLAPGEKGVCMVIAADRRQARVVFGYIAGLLDNSPLLSKLVANRSKESIELRNGINIEVHTAHYRAVRGYSVVAAICDEIAFWPSEDSATPDKEILNGLRPGMATIPGSVLLCLSSPYSRRGVLYEAYSKHYGKDGDPVLVWQAPTEIMNPTIDKKIISEAYEADPSSASAEYGAQFRRDIESFVTQEVVDACVVPGRFELLPVSNVAYTAFADPSGGSQDSYTLAIAHMEDGIAKLDAVREIRPPFNPESATAELAAMVNRYRISFLTSDRYAGEWVRSAWEKHQIELRHSKKTKSDLYRELLPLLNSGRAELLDDQRLQAQLLQLERRTARGGKDAIQKAPHANAHDDRINSAAGALILANENSSYNTDQEVWGGNDETWDGGPWERISIPL